MSQPARGRGPVPEWVKKAQEHLLSDAPLWAPRPDATPLEPLELPPTGNSLRMDLDVAMRRALIQWHDAHPGQQAPPALIPNWTAFDRMLAEQAIDVAEAYIEQYRARCAEA